MGNEHNPVLFSSNSDFVISLLFQYTGNWFTQFTTPAFFQPEGTSCQRAQYGLNKVNDNY